MMMYNRKMTILEFQKHILSWYKTHRRSLPWRNTKDPYKILVSEVMLQQTQVARVLPKYKEFLQKFPTLKILAKASDKTLLRAWAGLGYWRRAKYLKQIAQRILAEAKKTNSQMSPRRPVAGREHRPQNFRDFEGRSLKNLFSKPKNLEKLPGIGSYTARALACFAFGNTEAFLDTNIRRVYLHFFFKNKKNVSDKEILAIAQKVLSQLSYGRRKHVIAPREWHYALFDYGAMVLKDKRINRQSKHYAKQSKFEGSFRSFRTKVMRFLLNQQNQTATKSRIKRLLKEAQSPYAPEKVLAALEKDGLIKKKGRSSYSL